MAGNSIHAGAKQSTEFRTYGYSWWQKIIGIGILEICMFPVFWSPLPSLIGSGALFYSPFFYINVFVVFLALVVPHQRVMLRNNTIEIISQVLFAETVAYAGSLSNCEFRPAWRLGHIEFFTRDVVCDVKATGDQIIIRSGLMLRGRALEKILLREHDRPMWEKVAELQKGRGKRFNQ